MKTEFTMPDGEKITKDFPLWKTPYNHDTNFESDRTATFCPEESLTKQEFRDEADINTILKRFMRTGEIPPMALPEHFVDMTQQPTYFDMHTRLAEANAMFYNLPAEKRFAFQNDPTRWADAVVQATEVGNATALQNLGIDLNEELTQALTKRSQAAEQATPPCWGHSSQQVGPEAA